MREGHLEETLRRIIAQALVDRVKDPRIAFVTINEVRLSRDKTSAQIFYTVLGSDEERRKSMQGLRSSAGFLQSIIGDSLRLKTIPRLHFRYDDSLDRSFRLEEILDDLHSGPEGEAERSEEMRFIPYPPPPDLVEVFREHHSFRLTTHVNPDADGIGSLLGLGLALEAAGKTVQMVRHEDGPSAFSVLPGYDRAVLPGELQGEDEVLVLLDCHELERIGPAADGLTGREKVVVIDHHLTGDGDSEGEVQWIEPAAAASASMVHSLVGAMEELSLSGEVASCLYAGLITDTGGFRFSNTDATTLHVGGDLVEHGADAAALAESFLHRRSPATLRLLARVLDSFDYRLGGKVVLARMTRAMCEETGGRMEDTEGFVNFATSAEGVELVALLKEVDEQTWRVSLRANDPYDVQRVAETFGGGGHAKAAGCTLQGPVEEVEERILEALSRELQMETAEG